MMATISRVDFLQYEAAFLRGDASLGDMSDAVPVRHPTDHRVGLGFADYLLGFYLVVGQLLFLQISKDWTCPLGGNDLHIKHHVNYCGYIFFVGDVLVRQHIWIVFQERIFLDSWGMQVLQIDPWRDLTSGGIQFR